MINTEFDNKFDCLDEADRDFCENCENLNELGNAVFNELEDRIENEIDFLDRKASK